MSLPPGSSTGHFRDTSRSRQVSAQHRPSLRQVTSLSISTRWHAHGYRAGWCWVVTCDALPATPCHPGTARIARLAVGNRHCGLRSWARAVRARSTAAGKRSSGRRGASTQTASRGSPRRHQHRRAPEHEPARCHRFIGLIEPAGGSRRRRGTGRRARAGGHGWQRRQFRDGYGL